MFQLQKSQLDDYHTPISMEQLHQAMQTSLSSTMVHNFQLPISPRQMSTLMFKTNSIRGLNFNEIPAHLSRNLNNDIDLHVNDLQSLRHEELIAQNLPRNLDISLVKSLGNDLDMQSVAQISQNLTEQDFQRSLSELPHNLRDLPQSLRDLPQNLRDLPINLRDLPHDLNHEIDLSHHLGRQNLEHELIAEERRALAGLTDNQLLEASLGHALGQRLEPNLSRTDQHSALNQRIEISIGPRIDRLDQRLAANMAVHDRQLDGNGHEVLPVQFQIKSEQEDEYFYDINHGLNNINVINGK